MKDKIVIDLGRVMDEVFNATKDFGEAVKDGFNQVPHFMEKDFRWDEQIDYYPSYSYPPVNVYVTNEKSLIFEFALAGFDEKSVDLQFQGDYMIFSAKVPEDFSEPADVKYFKRRLKFKDIKEQKYYVPEDKFDRENVKALFKNGVLRVTVSPNEVIKTQDGIKIEIVKEDE